MRSSLPASRRNDRTQPNRRPRRAGMCRDALPARQTGCRRDASCSIQRARGGDGEFGIGSPDAIGPNHIRRRGAAISERALGSVCSQRGPWLGEILPLWFVGLCLDRAGDKASSCAMLGWVVRALPGIELCLASSSLARERRVHEPALMQSQTNHGAMIAVQTSSPDENPGSILLITQ